MTTRLFDILFSGLALVVFSPLLVPVMMLLRLTGEGYIFYTQERVGKNGKKFGLLKFATMLKNSPNMGTGDITLTSDPRVLPLGHFLRKTKLNELPQLINIFYGDMSLVGPRPMTERNFNYYSREAQQMIASVRPGLTGVGSIIFRDEEQYLNQQVDPLKFYRESIAPYKAELECWYLQHASLLMYFKLIILTAWVVLFPQSTLADRWLDSKPQLPLNLKKVASSSLRG